MAQFGPIPDITGTAPYSPIGVPSNFQPAGLPTMQGGSPNITPTANNVAPNPIQPKPYDWKTAPSPFTPQNAPQITGALSGGGTTSEQTAPLPTPKVTPVSPPPTPVSPITPTQNPSIADSIIPKANAGEVDTIQKFLDDTSIAPDKKRSMLSALNENPDEEDAIRQHLQQQYYPQDTSVAPTSETPTTPTAQPQPTSMADRSFIDRVTGGPLRDAVGDTLDTIAHGIGAIYSGAENLHSKEMNSLYGTKETTTQNPYDVVKAYVQNNFLGKNVDTPNVQNKSVGGNLLDIASAGSSAVTSAVFPIITTAFNAISETPTGKKILAVPGANEVIGGVMGLLSKNPSKIVGMLQGLSVGAIPDVVNTSVDHLAPSTMGEEDKQKVKEILTNSLFLGAGALKGGENKVINDTTNSIQAIPDSVKSSVQSTGNSVAEGLLSSQWKMDRATKRGVDNATGMTPEKFALENGIVGKDVGATADNAASFKIDQIQQKLDAVKNFGDTSTPEVAKVMAKQVQGELAGALSKAVGAKNLLKLTPEQTNILTTAHPEQMQVIDAMKNIQNGKTVPYSSLEALKSLYDYYNPLNIKWGLDGKPESNAMNDVAATQRGALQKMIEDKGIEKGVDIKGINSKIQAAHAIQSGAEKAEGRMANHNLIGLGDTQIATLAGLITGGPGAVGSILLKKGILENQGIRSAVANKLYTKDVQNSDVNSVTPTPTISRVGRIMGNIGDSTSPVESKVLPKKPTGLNKVEPKTITKPDYNKMLLEAEKNKSLATTEKARSGYQKNIDFIKEQLTKGPRLVESKVLSKTDIKSGLKSKESITPTTNGKIQPKSPTTKVEGVISKPLFFQRK